MRKKWLSSKWSVRKRVVSIWITSRSETVRQSRASAPFPYGDSEGSFRIIIFPIRSEVLLVTLPFRTLACNTPLPPRYMHPAVPALALNRAPSHHRLACIPTPKAGGWHVAHYVICPLDQSTGGAHFFPALKKKEERAKEIEKRKRAHEEDGKRTGGRVSERDANGRGQAAKGGGKERAVRHYPRSPLRTNRHT